MYACPNSILCTIWSSNTEDGDSDRYKDLVSELLFGFVSTGIHCTHTSLDHESFWLLSASSINILSFGFHCI